MRRAFTENSIAVPHRKSALLVCACIVGCVISAFPQDDAGLRGVDWFGYAQYQRCAYIFRLQWALLRYDRFSVVWATLTLQPELPLQRNPDGTWRQASVAEWGPTSSGFGGPTGGGGASGGSTYVSTISAAGIATTYETGASLSTQETESVSSVEVLDLNTGKYTWHRVINQTTSGTCASTSVETRRQDCQSSCNPLSSKSRHRNALDSKSRFHQRH